MNIFLFICCLSTIGNGQGKHVKQQEEIRIVHELFRLRNEQKADSAEKYFADTVKVYMKYLRNVPKQTITRLDKVFFKSYPKNKFVITKPVQVVTKSGITCAIIIGKEYLNGTTFKYERIEIRFDRKRKINYFRAANIKNPG